MGIDQWITDYLMPSYTSFNGQNYPFGLNQTWTGKRVQEVAGTLPAYAAALRSCPPAFAAQMVRAVVLSQARFVFRNRRSSSSTPKRIFGTSALSRLEAPWRNATTGELLARMEWHAGLAGNAFVTRQPNRLRVLRPDWVSVVWGSESEPDDPMGAIDAEVLGYVYRNGGFGAGNQAKPRTLLPDEVAHWSPIPDPESPGMGQSWVTAALKDIQADRAATEHKMMFYANGAPQPLSAKVLTPAGWATMGDIRPGDRVIGADGHGHLVVDVYPQGMRPIYRVQFGDGTSAESTLDHVWTVSNDYDRRRGVLRNMTLADLIEGGFHYPSGPAKWAVPMVDPIEFDPAGDLPLDAYLMGLLLGDGSFRSNGRGSGGVSLACAATDVDETVETITPMLPVGVTITRRDRGGWSELYFRGPGAPLKNPMTSVIRDLGLFDVLGKDKSIPSVFLTAAVKDRVALLQGLIDSDGHMEATAVRFTTTSAQLAEDVRELVGSLGGVATVRPNKNRSTLTVNVRQLPEWIVPARLARKAAAVPNSSALRVRTIVGAEWVRDEEAQCIRVDSADHLYVTDDFVVTHNTPNMVVKGIPAMTKDQFTEIVDAMEERHTGVRNAYRTLYLTAGADATVVGSDLKQLDFKATQGAGETRIALLGRVPAPLLGISEGLAGSSLNAGNFGMARRMFSDTWVYPMLQDISAALSTIVDVPSDAELWFDVSDIPLLREDAKDAAEIEGQKADTIVKLANGGFTRKSAIAAVTAQDMNLLVEDPDWVSVQVQPSTTPAKPSQ